MVADGLLARWFDAVADGAATMSQRKEKALLRGVLRNIGKNHLSGYHRNIYYI